MDLCYETAPGETLENEARYSECMSEIYVAVFVGFCMEAICPPFEVIGLEERVVGRKILLNYMFNNMNKWHFPARKLLISAFGREWPCGESPLLEEK